MNKSIKKLLNDGNIDTATIVEGWVRTKRENKNVVFITINDGSTTRSIQVVADKHVISTELLKGILTGTSIKVEGDLVKSEGKEQEVEIYAKTIEIYGNVNEDYPLQKKEHSLEFLREFGHLRPRTNLFGAIFRLRHGVAFAIHNFFNERGFFYFQTPIITASDCEGAGSLFNVTTFDLANIPKSEFGKIDYKQDFFGRPAHLTVSGQLEAELAAMGLSKVYTFGPTFRAEKSFTTRHLSEFWMVEPEIAFYNIQDNMDLAEDFLKYILRYILDNYLEDIEFLSNYHKKEQNKIEYDFQINLVEKLNYVIENSFERITYTEAINILKTSDQNKKFIFPVKWGIDLQSEHERYLVEKCFKKPVIITDYPKDIKAFYMKQNTDGKTVRAMDILFPGIGEILGGSQREENYEKLIYRLGELAINDLYWYIDTRRFGTVPHSGFGLGFERLMLFVTGMTNIRDVIPFPRTPMNLDF